MSICFQLIELPENEQVNSRQVTLPVSGGTIGRSFECTIQLPDFSRTLSRVHAEVLPHPEGGFQIVDRSANGVFVNEAHLGRGESARLSDGDSVRIGGYLMLVSDMNELFSTKNVKAKETIIEETDVEESYHFFDIDSVVDDSSESPLDMGGNHSELKGAEEVTRDSFSTENVFAEDIYAYDPFEEESAPSMRNSRAQSSDDLVMLSAEDKSADPVESGAVTVSNTSHVQSLESSIERLNQLVEQQQSTLSASIDRDRLFTCIEATLERFLNELSPESLEDEFNDYLSGWGNKNKKYWALYKKQFNRKKERNEFNRHFTAILLEELRDK